MLLKPRLLSRKLFRITLDLIEITRFGSGFHFTCDIQPTVCEPVKKRRPASREQKGLQICKAQITVQLVERNGITKYCGKLYEKGDSINPAYRQWSKKCLGILRGYAVLDSYSMQLVPSLQQQEGWKMVAPHVRSSMLGSSTSTKCCSLLSTCGRVASQPHQQSRVR